MKGKINISSSNNISLIQMDKLENKSFYNWYIDNFNATVNTEDQLVQNLPQFLDLLCNLLTDESTDFNIKVLCSLALSYLVIEDDYYPDSKENGYLDDMFVITYALKQIKDKKPALLEENWHFDGPFKN